MRIHSSSFSECGPHRNENEDFVYCNTNQHLYVVADGLGGLTEGQYASRQATEVFARDFLEDRDPDTDVQLKLKRSLTAANRALFAESRARNVRFGTTFTALHIAETNMMFVHIGDTALWLFRRDENSFSVLTRQDTLERNHLEKGSPPILASQYRNILTQAVGVTEFITPQAGGVELKSFDLLVLCSDGFSGCVKPSEVLDQAKQTTDADMLAHTLRQLAIDRMPRDNFSAILLSLR
jgi:serine/threonine protein phosphatase PrpC